MAWRNRLAAAIEDHVRRVEVDEQILAVDVLEETQQNVRRLLAGFQMERLMVRRQVIAQVAGHLKHILVVATCAIVRHKADVHADNVDAFAKERIKTLRDVIKEKVIRGR